MRLLSLRMKNFRQFYGESPVIKFAFGDRNVTVVHGSNGAGKTALLNAFTWALYGSFSKGFQLQEQLVNKRALRESNEGEIVEAWVEIEFEHEDRLFLLRRTSEVTRTAGEEMFSPRGNRDATLQSAGPDGNWAPEEHVNEHIGRVLPEDLHTYFFFDGERIERLVQPRREEQADIAKATKKLLGVTVMERAERDLTRVRRELEKELREIGDPETVRLIQLRQDSEDELGKWRTTLEELFKEIEHNKERKRALDERLGSLQEAQATKNRKDHLTRERESRLESIETGRRQLAEVVNSQGYSFFVAKAAHGYRELVDRLRDRGELPSGIKRQFVDDLLRASRCICQRALDAGSDPRAAVERWMQRAGLADVEEKAIRMGGEIAKIEQLLPSVSERIDGIQQSQHEFRQELSRIETELDEIHESLKHSPVEEISGIQRELDAVEDAIDDRQRECGRVDLEIANCEKAISKYADEIEHHRARGDQQELARRRVSAADDAAKRIARVRELLEVEFRHKLGERVKRLFRRISVTPYVPDLQADYALRLIEAAGGTPLPVAASQGENQILSLAFIGSIIEEAREYQAKKDRLPGPDASHYPMVMDSPFGSLDPTYRSRIADFIPRLADQVALFVTKTQWRGEVEQALSSRIGTQYVLTYFTPRDDLQRDSIELSGQSYELVKASPNDFEYTEILEVP